MRRLVAVGVLVAIAAVALVVTLEPVWYLRWRYPLQYEKTIVTHARNYDLPAPLVAAVIMQESKFDSDTRSSAGAIGLMQLTPQTARGIALRTGGHRFVEKDLLDPEINIRYGCWYLRHMRERFPSRSDDYTLALAAYNAGQGRVREWLAEQEDGKLEVSEIPFAETRHYVEAVQRMREHYAVGYRRELSGS